MFGKFTISWKMIKLLILHPCLKLSPNRFNIFEFHLTFSKISFFKKWQFFLSFLVRNVHVFQTIFYHTKRFSTFQLRKIIYFIKHCLYVISINVNINYGHAWFQHNFILFYTSEVLCHRWYSPVIFFSHAIHLYC